MDMIQNINNVANALTTETGNLVNDLFQKYLSLCCWANNMKVVIINKKCKVKVNWKQSFPKKALNIHGYCFPS